MTATKTERMGTGMMGMGTQGMAAPVSAPSMPMTGMNYLMVPRCTLRVEKCDGGMKIHCICDDKMMASMMQNLCTTLTGGMCSCCMMMNGQMVCCCNLTMGFCKCEMTKDGMCLSCTSGDAACAKMIQSCCDCMSTMLTAGCTCCLMMNSTPVCCGCC
jgi:hypothetical protein